MNKTVADKCKAICVKEMRRLLSLDPEVQRLVLGSDYKRQLARMSKLVNQYDDERINDWLKRQGWPFF